MKSFNHGAGAEMNSVTKRSQAPVSRSRSVERLVAGTPTSDGAGVRLTRVLTQPLQHRLDPFLMLDAFRSDDPDDYIAGFPDHPHRGFETVTYMIAGRLRHRDSAGHEGLLENGGVQWMTAGRGVIHSEMPEQEDGVEVKVIAGESAGVRGAVTRDATAPLYLDLHLPAGTVLGQRLESELNAFLYVYRGCATVAGTEVPERTMAILGNTQGDGVLIEAGEAPVRALLVAGRPLNEPIVQYGPFVMNREEEIYAAVSDYREGRLA